MGRTYDAIDGAVSAWIRAQHLFFVATAPRDGELVNCSPKGLDTLKVLGPREVAYLDLAGSGIETVAHLKENGRIVLMFCAFEGEPRILRLHGRGSVVEPHQPEFDALLAGFPEPPVCRAIVRIAVARIQDSCGYGVPLFDYRGQRDDFRTRYANVTREGFRAGAERKNTKSLEGLPGLALKGEFFVRKRP